MSDNNYYSNSRRYIKILAIVWALTITYVMLYYTGSELYVSRFEGPFLGYIELFLHGYISLDNFNFFPLIDSEPLPVDLSLPNKIQGVMQSESWIPNTIFMFVILCQITGIPPHHLILLPLGVFFVPLVILSILRRVEKNMVINREIALIGTYYVLFFIISRYYGSLYVAVFAMMLVFVILLCVIRLFTKDISYGSFWVIFVILMFSLSQYWHSALMMILFIITSLCIVYILSRICIWFGNKYGYFSFISVNNSPGPFKVSLYLLIISGVLSICFTHIWESSYLGVVANNFDIVNYLNLLVSKLFGETAFPVPYVYSYKDTIIGKLYFVSFLGVIISCSSILILSIMAYIMCNWKKHFVLNFPILFGVSLIVSQIIYSIVYYNTCSINFPLVFLFFPIGAIYLYSLIDREQKQIKSITVYRKLFYGILIMMVTLSFVMVITSNLTKEAGNTPLTKYDDTKCNFNWIYNKMEYDDKLIVDFNIFGKYMQRETQLSKPTIEYVDLNPSIYAVWVGDEQSVPMNLRNAISVVDKRTMSGNLPVQITGSRAALKQELDRINNSINLNKIYEDESVSLFNFS